MDQREQMADPLNAQKEALERGHSEKLSGRVYDDDLVRSAISEGTKKLIDDHLSSPVDREFETVKRLYRNLLELKPVARVRVLRYVQELLAEQP